MGPERVRSPSEFSKLVNPNQTKGVDYAQDITACPLPLLVEGNLPFRGRNLGELFFLNKFEASI